MVAAFAESPVVAACAEPPVVTSVFSDGFPTRLQIASTCALTSPAMLTDAPRVILRPAIFESSPVFASTPSSWTSRYTDRSAG